MATIDFVVSGNRIATESFAIGKIYDIIFTNGNSLICACNHVGNNFVVFQRELPELLFTLNMETASSVRSIEETGGGGGTYNYNELDNKPQINSVELSGNKSSSDLGLQSALDASQLDAVNSGITAAKVTAFEAKQDAITSNSKLSADLVNDTTTTNKFVTTADKTAWNAKQNALTTSQLDAVNSGITAAKVTAFEAKQDAITSNSKLSADLVNDSATANKFVTAADKTAWSAKQNALTASQLDAVNSGITAAKVTVFEGKQDAITSNSKLSADLVNDSATANKFVTAADKTAWSAKQNALTASQLDAVNSGITAAKVTVFEGKQDAITSNSKLSADLVNDSATTNKFVTAADKTAWNAKQNAIDSLHMLDADLVDDTTATHKFATAAQLSQITTNKNNISKCLALEGGTALTSTADLNNITTIGNYYCSSNATGQTIANRPTGSSGAFRLTVYYDTGTQYPTQLFDDFSTRKKWERKGNTTGTTFESWALIIDNLADYQKKLSSATKANADYIDDTSSTHKFATAAELEQITTNQNNISSLEDVVQAKITKSEVYNRGTAINTGDDLNDYTSFGKYHAATGAIATSLINCPITTGFVMTVEESFQGGKMQTLVTIESGGNATVTYRRSQVYRSSVWSWLPWYKFEGTAVT